MSDDKWAGWPADIVSKLEAAEFTSAQEVMDADWSELQGLVGEGYGIGPQKLTQIKALIEPDEEQPPADLKELVADISEPGSADRREGGADVPQPSPATAAQKMDIKAINHDGMIFIRVGGDQAVAIREAIKHYRLNRDEIVDAMNRYLEERES